MSSQHYYLHSYIKQPDGTYQHSSEEVRAYGDIPLTEEQYTNLMWEHIEYLEECIDIQRNREGLIQESISLIASEYDLKLEACHQEMESLRIHIYELENKHKEKINAED